VLVAMIDECSEALRRDAGAGSDAAKATLHRVLANSSFAAAWHSSLWQNQSSEGSPSTRLTRDHPFSNVQRPSGCSTLPPFSPQ
jgi:hypothetical protein